MNGEKLSSMIRIACDGEDLDGGVKVGWSCNSFEELGPGMMLDRRHPA